MTEVGTASSTKNTNGTAIFGNGRNAGSISLKDKNNKTVSIQSHDTISSSYKIIMPQSIGTADEVLKISSVSGTNAVCEWGAGGGGGGGGSGIVNNRIDGDLTIGEDDSEMLTIASKLNIPGGETGNVLIKDTDGLMKLSGSVTTSTIGTKIDGVPVSDFGTNGIWQIADNATANTTIHKIATITLPRAGKYLIFTSGIHFMSNGTVRHSAMIRHGQSFGGLADSTNNSATDNAQLRVLVENYYFKGVDSHKDFNICLTCYYEWDGVTTDGEQLHLELDTSSYSDNNYTNIYWGLHPDTINQVEHPGAGTYTGLREVTSVFQAIQIGPSSNQIPLHPSLPEINTSEAGKSLTVNSQGTALEYGPQVLKHNMNFKNIYEHGSFQIPASTANNNPAVHPKMNITITPQLTTSKVMITVNIMGEIVDDRTWDTVAYLRKTINGVSTDILPPQDSQNTNGNRGLGQFVRTYQETNSHTTMEVCNFHYIDEPNTISTVTYNVLIVCDVSRSFKYNRTASHDDNPPRNNADAEFGMSFMSAEEKFANDDGAVGAITSFTQEQALAGGGGTLFQSVTSSTILGSAYPLIPAVHNNIIKRNLGENQQTLLVFSNSDPNWTPPANVDVSNPFIAYEFAVPQIVTSYRIWHAQDQNSGDYIPKEWELRASADSSTYVASNSNTYTLLDSQTNQSFTLWSTTGQLAASDNLDLSNLYHINTVGAFKYFVLYFKDSNDSNKKLIGINEWALYGGGFTIPSQIGNAGKQLITNGTSLTWGSPSSILVPSPTGNANKVLQANSAGNALEYMEGGSIIQTSHRLERGEYYRTINRTNYNPDTNDYQIDSNFKVGFTPTNSNSILRFSCDFNIGTSRANMWLLFHLYRRINGGTWVRINVNNTSSPTRYSTFLAAPRIEVAFSGPGTLGSITTQQLRNMQGEYFDNNWSSSWTSGQLVEYTIYWQYLYGQLGDGTMRLNRTESNPDWGSTSSTLTLQELNHSNTTLSS